jgi:hypothetical protein
LIDRTTIKRLYWLMPTVADNRWALIFIGVLLALGICAIAWILPA